MAMKIPKRTFKGRYEIAPLSAHARPTDEDQKAYCVVWQKNDKSEFHLCQHTYIHICTNMFTIYMNKKQL